MINFATAKSVLVKVVIFSLLLGMFYALQPPAEAAAWSSIKDTMSRLKTGVNSDHEFQFTLPGVTDFDTTGGNDAIYIDFPDQFVTSTPVTGTWATSDFTFTATGGGGSWTVFNVDASNTPTDPPTCAAAPADGISVTVDYDQDRFGFTACPTTSFKAASGVITITIKGSAGDGLLTNGPIGTYSILTEMKDENVGQATTGSVQVPIVDDDTVNITANVDPTLVFDIDTSIADANTDDPYFVALGSLSKTVLTTSNHSSINSIFLDMGSNATGGMVVTLSGDSTGLYSPTTTHRIGLSSVEETIVAGQEKYGICVESATAIVGSINVSTQYDANGAANCTIANGGTPTIGRIETSPTTIVNSNSAAVEAGRVEMLIKASITATTPAANDYANTLMYIATCTY